MEIFEDYYDEADAVSQVNTETAKNLSLKMVSILYSLLLHKKHLYLNKMVFSYLIHQELTMMTMICQLLIEVQ